MGWWPPQQGRWTPGTFAQQAARKLVAFGTKEVSVGEGEICGGDAGVLQERANGPRSKEGGHLAQKRSSQRQHELLVQGEQVLGMVRVLMAGAPCGRGLVAHAAKKADTQPIHGAFIGNTHAVNRGRRPQRPQFSLVSCLVDNQSSLNSGS